MGDLRKLPSAVEFDYYCLADEFLERTLRGGLWMRNLFAVSFLNPACPWLPEIRESHDFSITRRHGSDRGGEFYLDALRYAQSQWCLGKPAQAILQLNKAWLADVSADDPALQIQPQPYHVLIWILEQASTSDCGYLGNPVRHFQHLASRMSGPRAELRTWRAWLCFHLAEKILNRAEYPRDGEQIVREGLWIPSFQRALNEVSLTDCLIGLQSGDDVVCTLRRNLIDLRGGSPANTF